MTAGGEFRSTFLIDTTGRNQWLARKLKLKVKKFSPNLIVRYGYMEGKCPYRDKAPSIVADSNGWNWTAQVRPKVYQWTRLSFDNKPFRKYWIPKEFKGLKLKGNISGADMTWRIVIPSAGPGLFSSWRCCSCTCPYPFSWCFKSHYAWHNGWALNYEYNKK
ncbi:MULTISPECIES: hypothetical protein [Bacillus cereus group]|uniref:hypothetical protein n=1 Tax=Bacillus cereus group TaxID=86661 RepID=UPI0006ACD77C|nr:hypothetical protein [Bacillus cereus]MDR4319749.1 hypothetical protein [Bacillus paranthracis]